MESSTLAAWVASIAAVLALIPSFISGLNWYRQQQTQRLLEKRVGSNLYPSSVLDQATRYYVEPDCSNIDPAREEEIRNVVATKAKVYAVLDDFFEKQSAYRHMIILADSGMGKTSLLINYFVRNHNRRTPYKIKLLPLGIPDLEELIQQVPNKEDTTIFLDAFDEDTKAIADHKERLRELMDACRHFDRVVITCRTQFFPEDEEIPKETGVVRIGPRAGGEGREYTFQKLYLMPLTDQQIAKYLRKRYPLWQWKKRQQAKAIVEKIPLLSVRPMLLAHIPDLLDQQVTINHSYELYEAMIEAWLQREKDWIDPETLRRFSERLAVDLYVKRERRGAERLPREELAPLLQEWRIQLDPQYISGRSLLNRDAQGNLKFAHRSIMEYLFLCCEVSGLEIDWRNIFLTDQMAKFVQEAFTSQRDLSFKNLPNCEIRDLKRRDQERVILAGVNMVGANLIGADLRGADLSGADLREADLSRASLIGAHLRKVHLSRARYDSATRWPDGFDFRKSGAFGPNANLSGADLSGADLSGADLSGADLSRADLSGADLSRADLSGAYLRRARYDSATRWPDRFSYKSSGAFLVEKKTDD